MLKNKFSKNLVAYEFCTWISPSFLTVKTSEPTVKDHQNECQTNQTSHNISKAQSHLNEISKAARLIIKLHSLAGLSSWLLLSIYKNCWSWLLWLHDIGFFCLLFVSPALIFFFGYLNGSRGIKIPNRQQRKCPWSDASIILWIKSNKASVLLSIKLHLEKLQYETFKK